MYIDSHCHLEDNDETKEIIEELDNNLAIVSGYDHNSNKEILNLCSKYKNLYGTIGIHPGEIDDNINDSLDFLKKNINNIKIVAIGEIGLDFHYNSDFVKQEEIFIKQLELARKYNKTVVIHSRDACNLTYEILKKYKDLKKVIHCYSYNLEYAKKFVEIGCMLGIGGVLTFKNSKIIKEVVENIDIKNLLIETDSPWLTPVPYRGEKNKPTNVVLIAKKIAEIKEIDLKKVIEETTKNTILQFDLNI